MSNVTDLQQCIAGMVMLQCFDPQASVCADHDVVAVCGGKLDQLTSQAIFTLNALCWRQNSCDSCMWEYAC